MNEKISVIIPVYQVEKYLRRCVNSVLGQSYGNLEVILVDDGSMDQSGKICDEFAQEDRRVKVIHKKNGGVSDARNVGLGEATGDLITFADPDDYIHPLMYEQMLSAMENNHTDIAMCGYRIEEEKYQTESPQWADSILTDHRVIRMTRQAAQEMYFDGAKRATECCVLWNKLCRRYLYQGIHFPVGRIQEDEDTTYKILYQCKEIVYLPAEFYCYTVREDGYMNHGFALSRFNLFHAYNGRIRFYAENDEYQLLKKMLILYLHMWAQYYNWENTYKIGSKKLLRDTRNEWIKMYRQYRQDVSWSMREQMEIRIYMISESVYHALWKEFKS